MFLLLTGQQNAVMRTKCTLVKKSCKNYLLQVKTVIYKRQNGRDLLKRLEQMYPVYGTELSVNTEIKQLPMLFEFPTASWILEFVAYLAELMGRMNATSYSPTEPHLWLVGTRPPETWDNCGETSEKKSHTHSYGELIDLMSELAMKREKDPNMEKYLRRHLRREIELRETQEGGFQNPIPTRVGLWRAREPSATKPGLQWQKGAKSFLLSSYGQHSRTLPCP